MSELRRDAVSKDWIIMAPERAWRPHALLPKRVLRRGTPKKTCPFEDLKATGNWPPILSYPNDDRWQIVVIPNKYPALVHHQACTTISRKGPYEVTAGIGHHDLVVTRDHNRNFADLSPEGAFQVLSILQKRYRILAADRCLLYTSTFFNWGAAAGASIYHPHYQVLTLPIIPPAVRQSLEGSKAYFEKHRRCVHCSMIDYERKMKTRVVYNTERAIAISPFVSRQAFEVRVFPKKHVPFFEDTPRADLRSCAITLQHVLKNMRRRLNDPDVNFFIHTAPLKEQHRYGHYHWHVEIIPKILISAGFELSTGVEINVVSPDAAARILRK